MFSWLKKRHRQNLLASPIPDGWQSLLEAVGHYQLLDTADRSKLRDATRIFIEEKTFEGCGGLEVTEAMRVTIAALASILILGLDDFYFDNVQTILVYPSGFVVPQQKPIGGDVALETESENLGEAHYRGPIILSWDEVDDAARHPGHGSNLVFHEFAHQLDMLNGDADGVPSLPKDLRSRWEKVMGREYDRLCKSADRGRQTLIDPYGATNPAEFFAVITESFFDQPQELRAEHPDLYQVLSSYYHQDPAAWPWQ